MPREILIHLNVTLPEGDETSADLIADLIVATASDALPFEVVCPLAEEV